jgi:hypothetical protein
MQINELMTHTGAIVGIMVSVITFIVTYQKIANFKGEKAKELHAIYALIKKLSAELENNFSEIVVVLSGITSAKISAEEVRWFINEPRAFLMLSDYGKICGRYCAIDLDKGEFVLTSRVSTFTLRVIERAKIITVGLGFMAFYSLIFWLTLSDVDNLKIVYISIAGWFIYLFLVLFGISLMFIKLKMAVSIQGKP